MAKSKKKKKIRSTEEAALHKEYVEKQRRKSSIAIFVLIICVLGLVVCAMLIPSIINSGSNPYTYSEYQQLSKGMTYDDVRGVLGGDGDLQTGSADALSEGRTDIVAIYTWGNKNGSSISVAFTGGAAESIVQDGLDTGK